MKEDMQQEIFALMQEKENFLFLAEGLTYDHQFRTQQTLLRKAYEIQERITELEFLIKTK